MSTIAKNTSYFTLALIMQKVVSFSYFAMLARYLGPADLGKYYFAISLSTIFSIFIDWGLANSSMREVAKDQNQAQRLLSTILAIKLPLVFLIFGGLALFANVMNYPDLTKNLIYLAGLCMVLDSMSLTFFSIIRGFHNLIYESITSVIFQVMVLVAGYSFMKAGFGVLYLMGGLVVASLYMASYSTYLVKFKFGLKLRPVFDYEAMRVLMVITIPFGMFAIYQKIYTYMDTVLLANLANDTAVGLYQVSFKIINAIQFLPLAFVASLYPAFASYWKSNKAQLPITFERSVNYLLIISVPVMIGVIAIADKVILVLKDNYTDAVLPLQVIMLSVVFIFLNYPIGSLLNACDRQKTNTRIMGIAMVISLALNLFLIPRFGVIGASVTVVLTNFLMFILGMRVVPEIIDYSRRKILFSFLRVTSAAIAMGGFVIFFKESLNIFVLVILAAIIYFVVLFLVKGFSREDVLSVIGSLKRS